jgi:DNA-3-methyladenine glycosylase
MKLDLPFYDRHVVSVARDLVGCYLVHQTPSGRIIGRINEVEAYDGETDKACHAWGDRRTPRNEPLYKAGGIAHVYRIYGMYDCFNIVTGPDNKAAAVLIRGVEIVAGIELAADLRYGLPAGAMSRAQIRKLSDGPGKLCLAMGINRSFDNLPLTGDRIYVCDTIEHFEKSVAEIISSKRIGIAYAEEAVDFPWRFTG